MKQLPASQFVVKETYSPGTAKLLREKKPQSLVFVAFYSYWLNGRPLLRESTRSNTVLVSLLFHGRPLKVGEICGDQEYHSTRLYLCNIKTVSLPGGEKGY